MPWLGPLLCSFLDMNANRPAQCFLARFLGCFFCLFSQMMQDDFSYIFLVITPFNLRKQRI